MVIITYTNEDLVLRYTLLGPVCISYNDIDLYQINKIILNLALFSLLMCVYTGATPSLLTSTLIGKTGILEE